MMEALKIEWMGGEPLDFNAAKARADAEAEARLGETMLLSFWDRDRKLEAPGGASECHAEGCAIPGWLDYAQHHGGKLMVDIDDGRYVFCYRDLGEFA